MQVIEAPAKSEAIDVQEGAMPIDIAENPCPNCGDQSYSWGILNSNGGVWFRQDDRLSALLWGEGLRARLCNTCGNIQVFLRDAVEEAVHKADRKTKRKRKG
jgi:hypothetical protein